MPRSIEISFCLTTTYCKDNEQSDLFAAQGIDCAFSNQTYQILDSPDVTQAGKRKSRPDFSGPHP